MRRLAFIGLLMTVGAIGGLITVSGNYLLGAFMGMILGAAAAVVVIAFPRNHDEPDHNDDWSRD